MAHNTLKYWGGAKLGEGSKGIVYDLNCKKDEESFCKIIEGWSDDISGLALYSKDGKHKLEPAHILAFIKYISNKKNRIVKILKDRKYMSVTMKTAKGKRTLKRSIDDEIHSNMKILTKFGEKGDRYLSINPHLVFENIEFIACTISFKNNIKPATHVIFGQKCNTGKTDLDKLLIDILESIDYMSKFEINHKDIKSDNIMMCEGKYKLIDWGNATFKDDIRGGLFAGPLKYYLSGSTEEKALEKLPEKLKRKCPDIYNSELFKAIYSKIESEFTKLAEKKAGYLHANYKGNNDLFALGITIIEIVIRDHLKEEKYLELIQMLTSYINPVTPESALNYVKNTF